MDGAVKPGDARFFRRTGPHELRRLAEILACETDAPDRPIHGVAPLQTAGPLDVSFLDNRRYADLLEKTRAGAVILHPDFAARVPAGTAALVTPEPYVGWAKIATLFHPFPQANPGIHPSAIIDAAASIDATAEIGPGSVIGAHTQIGPSTIIGPLCHVGEGVVIGAECRIHAQVTISHAILGNRVVLFPGARIGQDGFGFAISSIGFTPVPQLGRVLIGDGAEIGANSCIDRGSAQDTVIGPGVHIDNLVQIGHNVNVGAATVIVAQAGVAGSTTIGPRVMVAAQAGLNGHINVGQGARIGAQAGIMNDVKAGESMMGTPANTAKAFFRELVTLRKLALAGRKPDRADG